VVENRDVPIPMRKRVYKNRKGGERRFLQGLVMTRKKSVRGGKKVLKGEGELF